MQYSDFHTHTKYSDGNNTPEEMVLAAIEKGLSDYGITDHSYTAFDTLWCMKKDAQEKYIDEIHTLSEKYKDKINVYAGIELDAFSENDHTFDYIIGSAHYIKIKSEYYQLDESFDCTNDGIKAAGGKKEFVKIYFDTLTEHIVKNNADIVGHIDIINKFNNFDENEDFYISAANDAVKEMVKYAKAFEMNTGAIYRNCKTVPYPCNSILNKIYENKGKIILDSDAHCTDAICYMAKECLDIAKRTGFNMCTILSDGKFKEVLL